MDHGESGLKSSVQGLDGRVTLLRSTIADNRLGVLNVDIAKLVVPVLVDDVGRLGKLSLGNGDVDVARSLVHLVQNPALGQGLARNSALLGGDKVRGETAEDVLGGLEDLVAELAVTIDHLDLQVDIGTASSGVDHGKAQGISTALGNTIGEGSLLILGGSLNLVGVQVAELQLVMETLQLDTGDDVERINDVAQTLTHLATLGITNKAMAEDFLKRNLASQLETEDNHASNPEEQDIPTSLEDAGGEQSLQVVSLVGPAERAERPETRREPG